MTCIDCIHWTPDAWQDDRGSWCTYGSKLVDGERIAKGRCSIMPCGEDDRWADDQVCELAEPRVVAQTELFGG